MLTRLIAIAAISLAAFSSWGAEICIDPGHGGSDPGASSANGGVEKTNVLNTSLKFRSWLNRDNADKNGGCDWSAPIMTRTSDVAVSLQGRCDIANNNASDRFMCIHNNASGVGGHGTETFCYGSGSANSFDLRNKVQYRMINAWGLTNRGNKTANFYVLIHTNMPAELCELGFIDASPDWNYVDSAGYQDTAALAHLYAAQTHYGAGAYRPY